MAAAAYHHLLMLIPFIFFFPAAHSHNITAILDAFPAYSLYNSLLSQTRVADEINSHVQVTCLVLPDSAMSSLVANHGLPAVKNVLRLLSLLKYFDPHRPRYLPARAAGTAVSATLYQLTVIAGAVPAGSQGYIKITYRAGGAVAFASARPGLAFHATYTKSVQQIPCSLSVLEISVSPPAVFPEFIINPPPAPSNLTAFLEDARCKIFASLITSSGVLGTFQSTMGSGFTLFAPTDDAFTADGAPDLTALSRTDLVTVLQYHALPSYTPKASLKTSFGPIATMASAGGLGMYNLSVSSDGDDVLLNTGVGAAARVTSTLLDSAPVCVIVVDSLLLPHELPSAAPAPFASSFLHLAPLLAPSVALVPASVSPAADSPADRSYPVQPINRTPRSPRIRSTPPPPRATPPPPPGPDTPDTPETPEVPDVTPYIPTPDAPPPHANAAANTSLPDPRRLAKTACALFVLYFVIIDRYFY